LFLSGATTRYLLFAGAASFLLLSLYVYAYGQITAAGAFLVLAAATAFEGATNKPGMPRATNRMVMGVTAAVLLGGLAWVALVIK
jgi:hypothetical protein